MANKPRPPIGRRGPGHGRKTFWLLVVIAAGVCLGGLFLTWTRIAVVNRSYALNAARAENARLHHELAGLKIEVATLQSTASIARAASHALNMVRPSPDQVVVLEPSRPGAPIQEPVTASTWQQPAGNDGLGGATKPTAPVPLAVNGL